MKAETMNFLPKHMIISDKVKSLVDSVQKMGLSQGVFGHLQVQIKLQMFYETYANIYLV